MTNDALINPETTANLLAENEVVGPRETLHLNEKGAYVVPDVVPKEAVFVAEKRDEMFVVNAQVSPAAHANSFQQNGGMVANACPCPLLYCKIKKDCCLLYTSDAADD